MRAAQPSLEPDERDERDVVLLEWLVTNAYGAPEIVYDDGKTVTTVTIRAHADAHRGGAKKRRFDDGSLPELLVGVPSKNKGDFVEYVAEGGRARTIRVAAAVVAESIQYRHVHNTLLVYYPDAIRSPASDAIVQPLQRDLVLTHWRELLDLHDSRRAGRKTKMPRSFVTMIPDVEAVLADGVLIRQLWYLYGYYYDFKANSTTSITDRGGLQTFSNLSLVGRAEFNTSCLALQRKLHEEMKRRVTVAEAERASAIPR
jgi:hypothetical protein